MWLRLNQPRGRNHKWQSTNPRASNVILLVALRELWGAPKDLSPVDCTEISHSGTFTTWRLLLKKKTKKQKRNSLCPVMSPAPSALLEKSLHSIPSRPTQEMTPTTIWLRCSEWKVDQLRKALASETPIYTRAINPNHSSPSKVKAVILRGNAFLTSNYAPPTTNA